MRAAVGGAGLLLLLALGLCGCYSDVKVVQGTVVAVGRQGREVAVRDERVPNLVAAYALDHPTTTKSGDVVRIAYRSTTAGNHALRLMNLTRQQQMTAKTKH